MKMGMIIEETKIWLNMMILNTVMYLLTRAFLKMEDKDMDEYDDLEYGCVPADQSLDEDGNGN